MKIADKHLCFRSTNIVIGIHHATSRTKWTECGKLKVKQSRYRPGVAQRVPGSY
jgi:hypothetical protein